jgi:hypothetical protein
VIVRFARLDDSYDVPFPAQGDVVPTTSSTPKANKTTAAAKRATARKTTTARKATTPKKAAARPTARKTAARTPAVTVPQQQAARTVELVTPVVAAPAYVAPAQAPAQMPSQQYVVMQPQRGTSGMAVASLVLGILWLGGLGALLAVIFGGVGLKQTQDGRTGGRGMAIAGLVLGIVGLFLAVAWYIAIADAASSSGY